MVARCQAKSVQACAWSGSSSRQQSKYPKAAQAGVSAGIIVRSVTVARPSGWDGRVRPAPDASQPSPSSTSFGQIKDRSQIAHPLTPRSTCLKTRVELSARKVSGLSQVEKLDIDS